MAVQDKNWFAVGQVPQRGAVVTADREQLLAVWVKTAPVPTRLSVTWVGSVSKTWSVARSQTLAVPSILTVASRVPSPLTASAQSPPSCSCRVVRKREVCTARWSAPSASTSTGLPPAVLSFTACRANKMLRSGSVARLLMAEAASSRASATWRSASALLALTAAWRPRTRAAPASTTSQQQRRASKSARRRSCWAARACSAARCACSSARQLAPRPALVPLRVRAGAAPRAPGPRAVPARSRPPETYVRRRSSALHWQPPIPVPAPGVPRDTTRRRRRPALPIPARHR